MNADFGGGCTTPYAYTNEGEGELRFDSLRFIENTCRDSNVTVWANGTRTDGYFQWASGYEGGGAFPPPPGCTSGG